MKKKSGKNKIQFSCWSDFCRWSDFCPARECSTIGICSPISQNNTGDFTLRSKSKLAGYIFLTYA